MSIELGPRQQEFVRRLRDARCLQARRGYLRSDDGWCAEGLLAEQFRLAHTGICEWECVPDSGGLWMFVYKHPDFFVSTLVCPPEVVCRWFGYEGGLFHLNDTKALTFSQIADRIEVDPARFFSEPV